MSNLSTVIFEFIKSKENENVCLNCFARKNNQDEFSYDDLYETKENENSVYIANGNYIKIKYVKFSSNVENEFFVEREKTNYCILCDCPLFEFV